MRRRSFGGLAAVAALAPLSAWAQGAPAPSSTQAEEKLRLELKDGPVLIQFLTDAAPRHVERIKILVRQGFYNNTVFHRVIAGFMAQGGDPTGTGNGGSTMPDLAAEFTQRYQFTRGMCGMARSSSPNSANSQFFIMLDSAPSLNGQYTLWGRVTAGMDVVDKIKKGNPNANGVVQGPDRILRATLVTA